VPFTKGFDYFSSLTEVILRHRREEMMLYLKIETTKQEINKRHGLYVASGKDLLVNVVHGLVLVGDQHPLVVRGKYQTKVQAEKQLMDRSKGQNLPRIEQIEQQSKVQAKVESHKRGFDYKRSSIACPDQILNASHANTYPF
jgi:hypothetical protein